MQELSDLQKNWHVPEKIQDALKENNMECFVPFNLWYKDPRYKIKLSRENNQVLRLRYWNDKLLTGLVDRNFKYNKQVQGKTLYQPFYPETFYHVWEICHKYKIILCDTASINMPGGIEAVQYYWECNKYDFYKKFYHVGKDLIISELRNIKQKKSIPTVGIYLVDLLPTMTAQKRIDNFDVEKLKKIFEKCKKSGHVILRMNLLLPNLIEIYDLLKANFKSLSNYIPEHNNKHDPRYYVICKKFGHQNNKDIIKNLLKKFPKEYNSSPEKWCRKYDMIPIMIPHKIDNKELICCLDLQEPANFDYLALRLDKVKRCMDSKPSFMYIKYDPSIKSESSFCTWELLCNKLSQDWLLKNTLKTKYNAKILTNAWLKMYEILSTFPLLTKNQKCFHICEAPGAFISSSQHYAKLNNIELEWYAQSLISDEALGDHYNLMQDYSYRWIIPDNGDITKTSTLKYYLNDTRLESLDFLTSDAGMQIPANKINQQEKIMAELNLSQIIYALTLLKVNGNCVLKTFLPFAEDINQKAIYLLYKSFEKIYLYKPPSSSSTNSEVYLICLEKKNVFEKDLLLEILESKTITFNPSKEFLDKLYYAARILVDSQYYSIINTLCWYYDIENIPDQQRSFQNYWLKKCNL